MGFKRNMTSIYYTIGIHRDFNNMLSKHKLVRSPNKPFHGLIPVIQCLNFNNVCSTYLQTCSQQDKLVDDELRMKSSAVEITTVEQLRNRITKVAKHKYMLCAKHSKCSKHHGYVH